MRRAPAVIVVLNVLVLLTAVIWIGLPTDNRARNSRTLQAAIPTLEAFVAKDRKLAFRKPVTIKVVDRNEVDSRFKPSPRVQILSLVLYVTGRTRTATHFVNLNTSGNGHIVGFYDNAGHLFIVGEGEDNPYTRSVIVHELTHALDDQYFGLGGLQERKSTEFDRHDAELALIEGDAERVRNDYIAQLSPADKAAFAKARKKVEGGVDPYDPEDEVLLGQESGYPYVTGAEFAVALAKAKALDAAFRSKAFTTHDVDTRRTALPRSYPAVVLPEDPLATDELSGTLGAHQLAIIIGNRVPRADVRTLAVSWRSDGYWLSEPDTLTDCLDVRLVVDPAQVASVRRSMTAIGMSVEVDYHDAKDQGTALRLHRCVKRDSVLSG